VAVTVEMVVEAVEVMAEMMAVLSIGLRLTVRESAVGGEDAVALDRDWVACWTSTLPLSSTLVSDSEGEGEDVREDGMGEVVAWLNSSSSAGMRGEETATMVEVAVGAIEEVIVLAVFSLSRAMTGAGASVGGEDAEAEKDRGW
jgi:hypothetical protein